MKKFKKFLAILLVSSMIFTTNAVNVFAEGSKANQEEQLNEESEEITVGAEEESVGAKLGEPEDEETVESNEEPVGAKHGEPEEEAEETTVGANVHGARPEDEENSTESKLGEPEIDLELDKKKNDDQLYGDPAKSLDYIDVSKYTITTYYVGDTYNTTDLEIKAYYDDESYETISYTGNEDKFSFNPDYVHNPFTEATTEDEHLEMEITYTEGENSAFATILLQVRETPSTESKFCIKYFNITGTNWTSIASREEVHNIINNPIVKEFTASTDTSEVAAAIGTLGYTNGFKKLTKDEYDNYTGIGAATHTSDEEIYNIAKENGVFDQWKLSPTETVYYGINYYYYDAELNYAENHSSGTWEIYDNTFDWNTDLSPHELVAFHNNDAEEAIVLPQVTVKGSDTYKMRNTSTGDIQYIWTWALQPDGMQERSFGDTENAWPFKPETKTLTLYAQWEQVSPPTPTTYTIKYDKNLPSGYTISTSMTWYTDSTSDDLSSNPIKISGSAGMTCENADGYVRKLEAWNTLADKSGTPYMFAENISSPAAFTSNPLTLYAVWGDPVVPTPGTDKFYIISYGNPTEYPNEKKIFAFDSTTTVEEMENFVANNISKCINPSGKAANGFYNMEELIPVGADDTQVRQILNDNYDLTKEKSRTLDKIVVWFEDYIPDPMGTYLGITFEGSTPPGPTPPGPTPPSPGGGGTGGGSGGGSSDPTHGPMGDLTKNPLYANALNNIAVNTANNIPQTSLLNNNGLYVQLKSMQENANTSFNNAKDVFGNTGYGQWLRVPNSTTWYFYAGDLNQVNGQQTQGFLSNGWFNLGWDGQDRWYHFDTSGVMQLGWYQEAGKTYFLQNDLNDNWYGKAVTGTQNIGGRVYNFDSTGALIN